MQRLRKVVLKQEISLADVWRSDNPEHRFDSQMGERFLSDRFELSRDGDDVTITGNAGSITLPWSSVLYVVPEPEKPAEVKPVASVGKKR